MYNILPIADAAEELQRGREVGRAGSRNPFYTPESAQAAELSRRKSSRLFLAVVGSTLKPKQKRERGIKEWRHVDRMILEVFILSDPPRPLAVVPRRPCSGRHN